MHLRKFIVYGFLLLAIKATAQQTKPNIVYILCDDLGIGDVKTYNPQGKIATPNMDQLAKDGMKFTDAHTSSAVCTPSRYAIITGRYSWRSVLQSSVLASYSTPLVADTIYTQPQMLKQHGYKTACIGKWHLGMSWATKSGGYSNDETAESDLDFTKTIKNTPTHYGFDYYFGIAASLDMSPYLFIENDKAINTKTEAIQADQAMHYRKGLKASDFDFYKTLEILSGKADNYISANSHNPFFLYFALPSPHTPLVPGKVFQGKSNINAYSDYVMETDWVVGEIVKSLEKNGVTNNTMIVFASDNGYAPYADSATLFAHGHNPSYIYRGYKADIWDGGHRVPLIVKWPSVVKPGAVENKTICLVDLMATAASILQTKLPGSAAPDSYSFLSLLKQNGKSYSRPAIIHHSINGNFAIRQGKWKLILGGGSGGWSKPSNQEADKMNLPKFQLYDMDADPSEKNNLQAEYPKKGEELYVLLQKMVGDGRSTAGKKLQNDVPVDLWKIKDGGPSKIKTLQINDDKNHL
ncbi:MAG: arylsulfatase [Chitinophagaceae bacterium]